MYEIFHRTALEAGELYHANITASGMQAALRDGYPVVYDDLTDRMLDQESEELIKKNTNEVFGAAMEQLMNETNRMHGYGPLS